MQYPAVASVTIFSTLGTLAALGVSTILTSGNLNWRYAFVFGALVAITGTMARTTLKETPDFIDAKRRIKSSLEKTGLDPKQIDNNDILKQKTNLKTFISYFVIQCYWTRMALFCLFLLWKYFNRSFCI
ncbi:MAG TPA: hypothetical protein LFW14_00625 [Rickettsia endosymbiont of Degeeriella rufa]|nr:hypothetical protein [Rickettsia endosymbiont of Columbicola hoogstraali]HJD62105.1 hypothetical protein [Rickettsia endosymbiont of Degeeriella rufa]